MAIILDGRQLADDIKTELKEKVERLKDLGERVPHLAIIIVGDDGASHTYVNGKVKACKEVGFDYTLMQFTASISERKLLKHVRLLNEDDDIDGFIVQLPLPDQIAVEKITEAIAAKKDVDGFTNQNFGSILSQKQLLLPATPYGVMELLERYKIELKSKHCVIVGMSRLTGAPLSLMFQRANGTVTICNKYTNKLSSYTKDADVLVVAVGKPGLVKGDMIKKDAVVIDIGTTRINDSTRKSGFSLAGDVDFETAKTIAGHITPVPGGIGPMTIASLLVNTMKAYNNQKDEDG